MNEGTDRVEPATVRCPSCASEVVTPAERCPSCGLMLVGPLAAALWSVDVERERLDARRALLLERLRITSQIEPAADAGAVARSTVAVGGPPPAPETRLTAPYGPPPAVTASASRGPALPLGTALTPRRSASPQSVLLGLGVLLLLVAGTVFVAVAWETLGVYGQFALLLAAIALCVTLSATCERRDLTASAEALAALGVGLMVVGVIAAYRLDVAGLGELDGRWYAAASLAVLAVVTGLLGETSRRCRAYALASVVAAWCAVVAACGPGSLLGWVMGLVAGWALLASPLTRRSRERLRGDAADAGVAGPTSAPFAPTWDPALASGLAGLAAGTALVGSAAYPARQATVALVLLSLVVVGVGWAWSAHRPFASLPAGRLGRVVALWCVVGMEIAAVTNNFGGAPLIAAAAACTAGLIATLVVRSPRTQSWSPQLGCVFAGCGVTAVLLQPLQGVEAGSALAFGLLAVGSAALAIAEPTWRPGAIVVAAGSAFVSVGFAVVAADLGLLASAAVFAGCGLVLAALSAWRIEVRAVTEEPVLVAMTALGFAISLWLALLARSGGLDGSGTESATALWFVAGVLGLVAALLAAYALVPGRGGAVLPAAVTAIASLWTVLLASDVELLEAYSLSAAAICALVGAGVRWRRREASSWLVAGPAVGLALLPSAYVAADDASAARLLAVLGASAALLLVGVAVRSQALVAIPAVSLVLVSLPQAGTFVAGLPQWLSFGAVGIVLVTVGVRYERAMKDARALNAWFDALH